ncbi:MAG: MBL fold metallo-hydrolase [Myxococcota bacterium]
MRATLLGHASYVVEGGGATIFVDPVFFDPFEKTCISCPKRVVHRDKLPRANAVFLSHAHRDHFDQQSLETLPRSTPVYVPDDDELRESLHRMGFYKVQVLSPFEPTRIKDLSVIATFSRDPREYGFVWVDDSAAIWDQVDTIVDQRSCVEVAKLLERPLDVAIVTYMPLLEYAESWVSEDEFPRARYDRLLETALMAKAGTVIPGSSGERHEADREWLNHRIFPASREKFLADLRDIAPEQKSHVINPGDTIVVERGKDIVVERSAYADTIAVDTDRVRFDPASSPPPPLVDDNLPGYEEAHLAQVLGVMIEQQLPLAMRNAMTDTVTGPLRTLWDRRAHLQLEFVTPKATLTWHLASWSPPAWKPGAEPKPDYVFRYVASDVVAYIDRKRADLPRGYHLRFDNPPTPGEPYRLMALDPARLHGVDIYWSVDEQYWWSPLLIFTSGVRD